jgi:hypothetical protein
MGFFSSIKNIFLQTPKLEKRSFNPQKVSIEDVELPNLYKKLDSDTIKKAIKDEFSTYKSLNYKDKSLGALEVKTYHSFQIGMILRCLQLNCHFFIHNKKDIFPPFMENYSDDTIQSKVFDIIHSYDLDVSKAFSKSELLQHNMWSPLNATYLLYYLASEK